MDDTKTEAFFFFWNQLSDFRYLKQWDNSCDNGKFVYSNL